jgi:uncharacterized protein (DUF433 family)
MEQIQLNFGQGFYTSADISKILGIKYSKVNYWFSKYVRGLFESDLDYRYYYDIEKVKAVNFHSLIEMYVFNFFREHSISVPKIIAAHKELSKLLGTKYPFASSELLLASGDEILLKYGSILTEVTPGFQQVIYEYVMPYASKIEFVDNLADKYYPLGKEKSIVVNPKNQFGCPIINGTNIKVSTLVNLYKGGEKLGFISKLYNISEQQVQDAILFSQAA